MKKGFFILLIVVSAMMVTQGCTLPLQGAEGEEHPEGEFHPEESPPEEHPPEEFPPGEHPPEEGEEVRIEYYGAHRTELGPGECTIIEWGVHGSHWVFINENPVEPTGMQEICPLGTESYRLTVDTGERVLEQEITIIVTGEGEPQQPVTQPNQPAQQQQQPQPPSQSQPQSGCAGAPIISTFVASPSSITAGQSTTLSWGGVTNGLSGPLVMSVTLEPGFGEVGSPGSRVLKPQQTTTYTLKGTGCGGTTQKQLTVTVNAGAPAQTGIDIALTDLYPDSQPKGTVYVRVTNNGPGNLSNAKAELKCTSVATSYSTGAKTTEANNYPTSHTINLNAGQTKAFSTSIVIDISNQWYDFTCNLQVQGINDPKSSNNSYSETFPPPP